MIPRLLSPLWLAVFSLCSLAILPIVDKKVEAAVLASQFQKSFGRSNGFVAGYMHAFSS